MWGVEFRVSAVLGFYMYGLFSFLFFFFLVDPPVRLTSDARIKRRNDGRGRSLGQGLPA